MYDKVGDSQVKSAFYYALGRTSFVKQAINFLWSNWHKTSQETKDEIITVLREALDEEELQLAEIDLILTFTQERVDYRGCLGNRRSAGYWSGFYKLVT